MFSFSVPGSSVGIFCSTPGIPLARAVPRKLAGYMLMTGLPVGAPEALQGGLISRMTGPAEEDLDREVHAICEAIKAKPRGVVAFGKRFYHRQLELGLDQALEEGARVMVENLTFKDAQEGISAFLEKRKPEWGHTDDKVS